MLSLPEFELIRPRSLQQAVEALRGERGEALVIAGGTDLIPNMKNGLHAPRRLVSLREIAELRQITALETGELVLGAGCTLASLAAHPFVDARYPALAKAAASVAGPSIRNLATLGGNICLDTRCAYYNQSEFWRNALGYCLKKDGNTCHVVPKGQSCVAALSADTPSVLLAYGARVQLVSERGERWIPMDAFYTNDGSSNNVRTHDEILAAVALPPAGTRSFSAYHKLAARKAIDFPLVSLALVVRKNEDESIASLRLAVGAIASRPRLVRDIGEIALGRTIDAGLVAEIAAATRRQCHPLLNVTADTAWRRDVLSTCVRRAFDELVASMDTGA